MASNLSALITDAFDIYSEAYVKIAELGSQIADLDGKPRQAKKYNQLIEATRLYRVVSNSINLNAGGTAIEGITGDVQTMNNLLLKLKRSVGLNSLPQFPTPLTTFTFDGSCECSGSSGCPSVDSVDTTGALLTFDFEEECRKLFLGSADITSVKTWVFSKSAENTEAALEFKFSFVIDGLTPGDSTHDQTMPATVKMSDGRVVPGTRKWRPYEDGEYLAKATSFNNGTSWKLEISDVYI